MAIIAILIGLFIVLFMSIYTFLVILENIIEAKRGVLNIMLSDLQAA